MFRILAAQIANAGGAYGLADINRVLTGFRPSQLEEYLEDRWRGGNAPANTGVVVAWGRNTRAAAPPPLLPLDDPAGPAAGAGNQPPLAGWPHLSYAYLLECTRMVEIFRQVVYEYAHGERLPLPGNATRQWARVTEELFFSPRPGTLLSLSSSIRPDPEAIRRNAYFRLIGADLVTGMADGRPYPYVKATAANRDFSTLFEALMTESWRGYINRSNTNNEKATDDDAITTLTRRLGEMLISRRLNGALNREEFAAVALLSWCALTIQADTAVVQQLNAIAGGVADRLRRIGELVGIPPHSLTDSFLQLADPVSNVLTAIELSIVNNAPISPVAFYNGILTSDVLQIVTHWSIVSGRDLKQAPRRTVEETSRLGVHPSLPSAASTNGSRIAALAAR